MMIRCLCLKHRLKASTLLNDADDADVDSLSLRCTLAPGAYSDLRLLLNPSEGVISPCPIVFCRYPHPVGRLLGWLEVLAPGEYFDLRLLLNPSRVDGLSPCPLGILLDRPLVLAPGEISDLWLLLNPPSKRGDNGFSPRTIVFCRSWLPCPLPPVWGRRPPLNSKGSLWLTKHKLVAKVLYYRL